MQADTALFQKRLIELSQRAYQRGVYVYTDFLDMNEQSQLGAKKSALYAPFVLFGGADGCERRMARFGECAYEEEWPIACVHVRPAGEKFSEPLTHRDFLGALMHLGMERSMLGDVVVRENSAYVFCLAHMAPLIVQELERVRHTAVRCKIADALPEGALYTLEPLAVQAASERADGVIAKVYRLSREACAQLFAAQRVFVNAAHCSGGAHTLRSGDVVSVRGYGRFIYHGVVGASRKGKLKIRVEQYLS